MTAGKKHALVTGGGRGIGRGIALALARAGMGVVCTARSEGQVQETRAMIEAEGGRALAIAADVTKAEDVARVAREAEAFGPIDVLINNAGAFRAVGASWEVDPETWWRDVTTNMLGPFLVARAILPGMIGRNAGTIINMCGGGSDRPFLGASGYGSSKAGLMRMTDTLAFELAQAGHNIQVYGFDPGLISTAMTENVIHDAAAERWMPKMIEWLAEGKDHPVEESTAAILEILRISRPELSGRLFCWFQNFKEIERRAEDIQARDTFQIRYLTHL